MSVIGRVENGKIVLDIPVNLPDGTVVEIRPVPQTTSHHPDVERYAGILSTHARKDEYFEYLRKKHS